MGLRFIKRIKIVTQNKANFFYTVSPPKERTLEHKFLNFPLLRTFSYRVVHTWFFWCDIQCFQPLVSLGPCVSPCLGHSLPIILHLVT